MSAGPPVPPPSQRSTSPEHDAYLERLAAQFDRTGRHWQIGTFQFPTEAMWHQRFDECPELFGQLIRDIVLDGWWADHAGHTGRRPHVVLTGEDLIRYLPAIASSVLPTAWPDRT